MNKICQNDLDTGEKIDWKETDRVEVRKINHHKFNELLLHV